MNQKLLIKTFSGVTLIASALTLIASGSAHAFPFHANPESFAQYLNTWEWEDGKKRVFSHLRKCTDYDGEFGYFVDMKRAKFYKCEYGYLTITDIINGRRFCELTSSYTLLHSQDIYRNDVKAAVLFYDKGDGEYRAMHAPAFDCKSAK